MTGVQTCARPIGPSGSWRLTAVYSILDMDVDRERNNQETPERDRTSVE